MPHIGDELPYLAPTENGRNAPRLIPVVCGVAPVYRDGGGPLDHRRPCD
jgi:hypothetical protein